MSEVRLVVEQAGPLTSIQDAGRPGLARYGVPASGPVDRLAFAAAMAALGNPPGGSAIELSLGGLTVRCLSGEIGFVVAGGDFAVECDGIALGGWMVGRLTPGMRLRVREGARGNWAYLAFAGVIEAPSWLGSRSTHLLSGLGGGRIGAAQDIRIAPAGTAVVEGAFAPPDDCLPIRTARIVLGPQDRFFTADTLKALTDTTFHASAAFDRMGLVLDGPPLIPSRLDMPSEPAMRGALQVNGEGRLTLLSADHQTTGGYPKIGVVIDADCDRVAQLRHGEACRLAVVEPDGARAAARERDEATKSYLASLAKRPDFSTLLSTSNLIDGVIDARRS